MMNRFLNIKKTTTLCQLRLAHVCLESRYAWCRRTIGAGRSIRTNLGLQAIASGETRSDKRNPTSSLAQDYSKGHVLVFILADQNSSLAQDYSKRHVLVFILADQNMFLGGTSAGSHNFYLLALPELISPPLRSTRRSSRNQAEFEPRRLWFLYLRISDPSSTLA